jgi:hypothetical protein
MTARTLAAALVVVAAAGPFAATAAAQAPKDKATRLMNETDRAKVIVLFAHAGAEYTGHKLTGSGGVKDAAGRTKPGHFYLEYKFGWKAAGDANSTTLSYFFDPSGNLTEIQVDDTTAELNQPFFLANLGIKALGATVYEAVKDKLTAAEQRQFQKFVADADAKGLLQHLLRIDLALSK